MTSPWHKLGLIFQPDGRVPWMVTHAALPTPLVRPGGIDLYVAGRNRDGCAQVGRCHVVFGERPTAVLDSQAPLVAVGPPGAFDDRGATVSAAVEHRGRIFLHYTGWSLGVTVPFYLFAGLAISDDGGSSFRKVSRAPILERSADDPFVTASGAVLVEHDVWRMWYVAGSEWRVVDGRPRHHYRIKYAESPDGVVWTRTNRVCIDYASADEFAIARPWVVRDATGYRMWYSYRGAAYRIGYAESLDGLTWERLDNHAGIDVSAEGWDSQMIEYPAVIRTDGREWMFYNGNGYGLTGIGCAVRPAAAAGESLVR